MKTLEQISELKGRGRVIDENTHDELIPAVDYLMNVKIVKYENGYSRNAYDGCFWSPSLDVLSSKVLVLELAHEHGLRKFILGPLCGRCLPGELNGYGFAWGEATPIGTVPQ